MGEGPVPIEMVGRDDALKFYGPGGPGRGPY